MQTKFLIAAVAFAASLPALAGTVMENTATPTHKLAARQTQAPQSATEQKTTPAVKPLGLLNTDATDKQAKAISRDTNRKIARGEIRPQRDPSETPGP